MAVIRKSPMKGKYEQAVDSESAYEKLQQRTHETAAPAGQQQSGTEGAPQGGILEQIGGFMGSIFGTNRPRGTRLSTGQRISREITRSVTNRIAGQIAADIGKSIGGSMGSSVGRSIVRGTLGGILRR